MTAERLIKPIVENCGLFAAVVRVCVAKDVAAPLFVLLKDESVRWCDRALRPNLNRVSASCDSAIAESVSRNALRHAGFRTVEHHAPRRDAVSVARVWRRGVRCRHIVSHF